MEKKQFTLDQLQALLNRVSEGDLSPGNIAKKYGTKDAVDKKAAELLSFLEEYKPDIKDKEAFDTWSSVKNRLSKQMSTGRKYANTLPSQNQATNLDMLNEGKAIKVAAQDPAARILEKSASEINPLQFKEAQRSLGTSSPNIMDVQNLDIAGAKKAALEGKKLIPKSKVGGGKLGALAALGTIGYSALKGEPVMAQDLIKTGAEALNPLPFSIDELKQETDKLKEAASGDRIKEELAKLNAQKEAERAIREEAARPQALEFGEKLEEMQQNQELESNMSPRMSEIKRRLNPYR